MRERATRWTGADVPNQQGRTVVITGANTGLGKDVARQLALRNDFDRIYLGCRNPAKAERARRNSKVGLLIEGRPEEPV